MEMLDKFIYKFFGLLDIIFNAIGKLFKPKRQKRNVK